MDVETIGKLVLAIILLLLLIGVINALTGKELGLVSKLKDFLWYR